ncbi:acyltransferase family protein [Pseudobutyrivibrio ruminis]|uniref:acyltransferase family protein n=1 Tax=Pseudobutyrivibrio ruminis TaxID=46206 RepID=UPI000418CE97|nr:acyltransferase family protein [Pseudobutyrivibrio ruminis]
MITNICMLLLLLFLGFLLLYKAELCEENKSFFDLSSTSAMRGFWSIIVIIVHTPILYQNRIQDMIGSFAYIGVTFFFMTSGYGLKLSVNKSSETIKRFWRNRLPKIIIPKYIVNVFALVMAFFIYNKVKIWNVFLIRGWVLWLLVCYLFFWVVYRFNCFKAYKDLIISVLVILFSLVTFFMQDKIQSTIWPTEIYGFIWGIILANIKEKFRIKSLSGWLRKTIIMCILSGVCGILYLKFKPIYFGGNYILKIILGILILLFILQIITRVKIGNKISLFIGSISYEVFLLHGVVFQFYEYYFAKLDSGVFIILSIITTIVIAWLVRLISKYCIEKCNLIINAILK